MEYYGLIKHIHMTCAGLTLIGFLIRGYWMITRSAMLHSKPVKILPHIIDTVLLVSAIVLVFLSGLYPFKVDFVTLKLVLLLLYIILGTVALKRGKSKSVRILAFFLALATLLGIYASAMYKPSF